MVCTVMREDAFSLISQLSVCRALPARKWDGEF